MFEDLLEEQDTLVDTSKKDDVEDMFKLLDTDEKPFKDSESASNNYKKPYTGGGADKPKTVSYWDKEDIVPVKIDVSKFNKEGKSFSVATFTGTNKLPADIKEKILEISKILLTKGYKFRHYGAADDELQNEIVSLEMGTKETYLPWKKFNSNITKPYLSLGSGTAYGIAISNHKVFMKLPASVRAILANQVHVMLGKECDNPIDLLLAYTACGSEHIGKGMDYKVTGSLTFFLTVCGESNIPVYNLKKEDCIKRLGEKIKGN